MVGLFKGAFPNWGVLECRLFKHLILYRWNIQTRLLQHGVFQMMLDSHLPPGLEPAWPTASIMGLFFLVQQYLEDRDTGGAVD